MLQPVDVVAVREVLAGMGAPALLAIHGRVDRRGRLQQQVLELERLDQVGVEHHRAIGDAKVRQGIEHPAEQLAALGERLAGAEHGGVVLHRPLHLQAHLCGRPRPLGVAIAIQPADGEFARVLRQRAVGGVAGDHAGAAPRRGPPEHDDVEQRVGSQAVGPVHRDAGRLADRHQARHDRAGIVPPARDHLTVDVAGNAAHVVVHGGQDRDRLPCHVDAGEYPRRLRDAGQALVDHLGAEVLQVQVDVVALRTDAAPLADLDRHRAADHVAGRQVLGIRRIAFHEALAGGVPEDAALAPHALGDQAAGAVDAGRVELHELHVLQRQPGAKHHAAAVARAGVGGRAGKIGAAVAARRDDGHVGAEAVQGPAGHVERHHAAALAVLHDQVDGEVLDEEVRVVLQRLLVERVQHGVPGTVGRSAGSLRDALAVVRGHAAEGALVDAAVLGARERHAEVLEFDHRTRRLLAHELDRVLVAEPVGALDGVVEVEAPVVLAHVAERGADAALRRHRVAARREHLGQAGRGQPRLGQAHGGAQARAAGADDDDVVAVVDELVGGHALPPSASLSTANSAAAPARTWTNRRSTRTSTRAPLPRT